MNKLSLFTLTAAHLALASLGRDRAAPTAARTEICSTKVEPTEARGLHEARPVATSPDKVAPSRM